MPSRTGRGRAGVGRVLGRGGRTDRRDRRLQRARRLAVGVTGPVPRQGPAPAQPWGRTWRGRWWCWRRRWGPATWSPVTRPCSEGKMLPWILGRSLGLGAYHGAQWAGGGRDLVPASVARGAAHPDAAVPTPRPPQPGGGDGGAPGGPRGGGRPRSLCRRQLGGALVPWGAQYRPTAVALGTLALDGIILVGATAAPGRIHRPAGVVARARHLLGPVRALSGPRPPGRQRQPRAVGPVRGNRTGGGLLAGVAFWWRDRPTWSRRGDNDDGCLEPSLRLPQKAACVPSWGLAGRSMLLAGPPTTDGAEGLSALPGAGGVPSRGSHRPRSSRRSALQQLEGPRRRRLPPGGGSSRWPSNPEASRRWW